MSILKKVLDNVSLWLIYALAALLPLVFTNLTTEYYESAKFFLLSAVTLILLLVWGVRIITEGKLELRKSPLDLFLILFLGVATVSTLLSPSKFTALFGLVPKFHGGLFYAVAVTLLYFLTVFNLKSIKQVTTTVNIMIGSGVLLAIMSLLSYFKVQSNIPLIGSFQSSSVYISMLLPLTLPMLLSRSPLGVLVNLTFAATLVLVGGIPSWIGATFALGLTVYLHRSALRKLLPSLIILTLVIAALAILSFSPALQNKTPLSKLASSFQRDAQLPFGISWKISASAFRDSPFLGTGPGTYVYDFTQYKPLEINLTPNWNVRFNSAHNFYLQTWAELGGLGIVTILGAVVSFILFYLKGQNRSAVSTAGLTFILLMALSPMTILTQTAGFLILALAMASSEKPKEYEFELGTFAQRQSHPLVSTLTFLPILALAVLGFYFVGKLAVAEYYHRQALNATAKNQSAVAVYNNLVQAEKINPYVDLYRTDLAQTNFALANGLASQKGPTEASPGGSLTDQDKNNIRQLISQSIAEGRAAVTLSPKSAGNWEILASIYRQVSGVATNGLQFSLDAYGRAIQLDPLNPLLRLNVGGVYYQLKNYDLAIRFFDDAASLKPDYSNALYNLAVALRDKGSYREGVLVAERLVSLLSKDTSSKDYQTASDLLTELKDKTPPSAAQPTTAIPSASLENKNLPKVLNLPQPEQIATPPAVKKQ